MEKQLRFIDLFAGIGGFRIAFQNAGSKCVFSCEIDKFARHTYTANFFEEEIHWRQAKNVESHPELYGDIRHVNIEDDIPEFEILAAGFPCPTFSIAGVSKRNALGLKHGFDDDDKGKLFFEIAKILEIKKPYAFLLENVKNLVYHNSGKTLNIILEVLDSLGYGPVTWEIFDAAKLVPQHRERIFIAGFRKDLNVNFDIKQVEIPDLKPKLKDILLPPEQVSDEYTISNNLWKYLRDYKNKHQKKGNGFGYSIASLDGVTRTMSARYHKDGSEILIEQPGKNPRMLTEKEAALLFGFPKNFKIPVSKTQAYRQFGNSVCVPLVEILAKHIVQTLIQRIEDENGKKVINY